MRKLIFVIILGGNLGSVWLANVTGHNTFILGCLLADLVALALSVVITRRQSDARPRDLL